MNSDLLGEKKNGRSNSELILTANVVVFLSFVCIYVLNPAGYYFKNVTNFNIPTGVVGLTLVFILFYFHKNKTLYTYWILILGMPIMALLNSQEINLSDVITFIWLSNLLILGYFFAKYLDSKKKSFSIILWTSFLMILSISLFNRYKINFIGNYLRVADAVVMNSFLIFYFFRKKYQRIILIIISLIALYNLNSRFALLTFLLSVFLLIFFSVKRSTKIIIIIGLLLLIFIFLYFKYNIIDSYHVDLNKNRLIRLIFYSNIDTSLQSRNTMLSYGLESIIKNFPYGKFAYYRGTFGAGYYVHNGLSFIAEFGIYGMIVFILFVFKLISTFLKIIRNNKINEFILMCIIYSLLGVFFAKTYTFEFLYFTLGLCIYTEKYKIKKTIYTKNKN